MSDLPKSVKIREVGPREGFQFEKGAIGLAANAVDHGAQAIGALRCKMFAKANPVEHFERVGGSDLGRRTSRIQREKNRDQTFDKMSIAVADEGQHRVGAMRFHTRVEPDLAGAAFHLVRGRPRALRKRRQLAP